LISEAKLPLSGLRVLDLSRVLAGPYCGMVLSDLGAEVTKIEAPAGGDETRSWGPPFEDGVSAYFASCNRGKTSIVLDLKTSTDQTLLVEQIKQSDVLIHNFTPEVAKKLGVDKTSLATINERLVVAAISGFGTQEPWAERPGYDLVIQALSGFMAITGAKDSPPSKVGVAVTDILTALFSVIGILAELVQRPKFSEDAASFKQIDVSLMHCAMASMVNVGQSVLMSGEEAKRWGNAHSQIVPYESFETQDRTLVIAVGNDQQFNRLCGLLERQDLALSSEYLTNDLRVANREALIPQLKQAMKAYPCSDLMVLLEREEIPFAPVNSLKEALHSKWAQANNLIFELPGGGQQISSPLSPSFGIRRDRALSQYFGKSLNKSTT
jgi:crotonobetainyl-CoA:carnitine CoA-transferase CaiB-like acyl-CoA transferase